MSFGSMRSLTKKKMKITTFISTTTILVRTRSTYRWWTSLLKVLDRLAARGWKSKWRRVVVSLQIG